MAMTMHWFPNASAPAFIASGLTIAAVFMAILSAPARSILRMSSTLRIPPPTVSGMKHFSAVLLTTSTMVSLPSLDAVMSRNTSSSASC